MEDSSQGADVCDDAVKRPIVLGIVDTSGMKSPVNRKRRWDQTELEADGDASPVKVFVAGESDSEYEVAPEIPTKKIEEGTVEKSVISDSLKRIQFCYDQDTDSEEEESNDVKTDETKFNLELEAKASESVQTCDIEPKIESVNNIENKEESEDGPDVDPAVMEVIFGSDFEPKTDFNDEESPKNVEIDNTEIITINPSDPLTEESMDMAEKSQENRDNTDKEHEIEDMKSPLENQEDVFVEALETQENNESEFPEVEENNSETKLKENIHVNSEETQENNYVEEQTQDILVQESIKTEENLESSEIEENTFKSPGVEETVHLETAKIEENVPLESVKVEENDINVDLPKIESIPMELNEIQEDFDEIQEMGGENAKMADIKENNDMESVEKELSQKNQIKDEESDYENLDIKEESVLEQESETQNSEDDKEIDENEEKDIMEISNDAKVDDIEVDYSDIKVEKNIPLLKTVKPILEERKHERLSPITLRIDRGSPLTVDCKSPLGKSTNSPHKQLEFTLKISKDANTNIPKATMSPKSNINLSPNSVWKLENDLKTSEIKNEMDGSNHKENVNSEEPEENIQKMIKKMLEMKEEVKEIKKELEETPTKVPRKRGRPRKIQPPPDPEPEEELDDTEEESRPMRSCRGRTKPIVVSTRKPRGGAARGGGRGRGLTRQPNDRESLSAYEKAELAKIEARKEKLRLDQIAKYKAIKEKKLAKKLKDEERRKRIAREKAEKAEAAAPQVFEEETRMSAPESGSRGHTPAPNRHYDHNDESQSSMSTPVGTGNKRGRMEIPIDLEIFSKEVTVDQLAEYQWQGGSELYMIQEQVSLYLGVKSFKRKYPQLQRRPVEAEERTFLEDSNLVPKSMCDLGLTAVYSSEILDIMFQDFPEKYEEFRKYCREKQAKEAASKQKGISIARKDGSKIEPREQALEAVANWNANLNRDRREDRQCAMDLQTFTVHYPEYERNRMTRPTPKVGLYPIPLIPGQFCDYYKEYTPTELMYFPLNTVLYGPLKPNEKQTEDNYDSGSDTDETSSSDDSSETSSESDSSEDEEDVKCKFCSGTKKNNRNLIIESLLQCGNCKKHMHPTCLDLTPEMIPHIEKYNWSCPQCKKCVTCKESVNLEKLMSCDLCNRGYHIYCVGLKKIPDGRWHCTICSYCTSCGTKDPGGSDWQHEFKKSEKGAKIYQRTLCTPCFKLWRKGKYCQICYKCYGAKPEEDGGLRQCNTCDRWIHKECLNARFGTIKNSGFQCDICNERVQSSLGSHGSSRSMIKV